MVWKVSQKRLSKHIISASLQVSTKPKPNVVLLLETLDLVVGMEVKLRNQSLSPQVI